MTKIVGFYHPLAFYLQCVKQLYMCSYLQRDKSPEHVDQQPPNLELAGNPSAFSVFASVRQVVLESEMKEASRVYMQSISAAVSDSECEEEAEDKLREAIMKMPKVSENFNVFSGFRGSEGEKGFSSSRGEIFVIICYQGEFVRLLNMNLINHYNN